MIDDLKDKKFGMLTVVDFIKTGSNVKWVCRCDCGKTVTAFGYDLKRGRVISCGCRKIKHGGSYTRIYSIWLSMKKRCNNKGHRHYRYYGGKGIKVCSEWETCFESFREWAMENGYGDDLTIDRIDPDGDYEPKNCQWISERENSQKAWKSRANKKRDEKGRFKC